MSRKLVGYAFLALAMTTVGSTTVAGKLIAADLPPFTATALRFALALPVFLLLLRLTGTPWPRPDRRDGFLLLLQAGVGSVGFTAFLLTGLARTSAADAGVILGALPAVTAVVAALALGERPGARTVAAVALATVGVLAVGPTAAGGMSRDLVGHALVLAAVSCEALFILIHKRLRAPVPPLALSAVVVALGLALATAAALAVERPGAALTGADPLALAGVAYYALVPTVGGFLLWYAGTARTSGAEAAVFTAVAPLSALALAAMALGEPVTPARLLGVALVLAAVAALAVPVKRRARSRVLGA